MICLFEFCVSWRYILVMYNLIPKKYGEPAKAVYPFTLDAYVENFMKLIT